MNVELMRRIEAHILAEPKRVCMGIYVTKKDWHHETEFLREPNNYPECGTIGCICGWAVTLTDTLDGYTGSIQDPYYLSIQDPYYLIYTDVGRRGRDLLELSPTTAAALFYVGNWPDTFRQMLSTAKVGTVEYAQVVVARMEYMIEMGL